MTAPEPGQEEETLTLNDRYVAAGHRIQTAIAFLIGNDHNYRSAQTKHLRTGIDMSKSDQAGLAALLIEKHVFTLAEYLEAITAAAEEEADRYERELQAVIGNPNVRTV